MRYGSVCSGIESATVAWEGLGWAPQWFSEIDPFCCALLEHYWGNDVPNLGDAAMELNEVSSFDRLTALDQSSSRN